MKRLILPQLCVPLLVAACTDSTVPLAPDALPPAFDVAVGTITQITTDVNHQSGPAISGDRIVWVDDRNGYSEIYMHDLATGTETRISPGLVRTLPAISGNRIVYTDRSGSHRDIYLYDLATGTETNITTNAAMQGSPDISGDRIVWMDRRNNLPPAPHADIYMYDLATGTETRITTGLETREEPAISGDRIVWEDRRNGNADIYMYDLATGTETQITTNPSLQRYPDISGDRIVWQDLRNGNWDIYMYDLATGIETQITTDPAWQEFPAVYGDRIVWQDLRNDGYPDIFMYDLVTGEFEIAPHALPWLSSLRPAIFGDRIVWRDNRSGNYDIYMFEIGVVEPPSLQDLADLVDEYEADGSITNHGTAESLHAFIRQIGSDLGTGDLDAACARFDHFISSVANRSGKQVEAVAAQNLIDLALALKDTYACGS